MESWLAARAAGAPYDLLLMDMQMPSMDGTEAPAGSERTHMLALTANAQEDRETALDAGLDELLVKPLDRERLRKVLNAALGRPSSPLAA